MRLLCLSVVISLACASVGCGNSGPGAASVPKSVAALPSHGGTMLPIAGGKGYVEVVVDADTTSRTQGKLSAYFYSPDGSGPLAPPPDSVTFTPDPGAAVPLKSKPDPAGKAALFESDPSPSFSPGRGLNGKLTAQIGGQAVEVPVASR